MRALSQSFMNNFEEDGSLYPILERVKKDHTLMLAIRDGYINIYYRGGNLLKLTEQGNGFYGTFFDDDYNKSGIPIPDIPKVIESDIDAEKWIQTVPFKKEIMDLYFSENNKSEREFQQLVARENNFSKISNESEYFISDIEFADPSIGARFDMLAIQWPASQRRNGRNCRAALIEMKYGDGALDGGAGLLKHMQNIDSLVSDDNRFPALLSTMEVQFNQLDKLGMLNFKRSINGTGVKLEIKTKPEVIFILANHNPRSTKLARIINGTDIEKYAGSQKYDLRFYVAGFAGYGLHEKCMLSLDQFRTLLNRNKLYES
jgi:hypothetical protein